MSIKIAGFYYTLAGKKILIMLDLLKILVKNLPSFSSKLPSTKEDMNNFVDILRPIKDEFAQQIATAKTLDDLNDVRISFLGKKGSVTLLFDTLKTLSLEEKKLFGQQLNVMRNEMAAQLDEAQATLKENLLASQSAKHAHFDVTAYMPTLPIGHLHPYTHVVEEIENIFISMGYAISCGPEVESDYNNFTALNIPADHPARDMYDTFWLNYPELLLRTHTSTVQSRIMQTQKPPIAVVAPGRCYRHEATDASHDFMFMQCEGFFIDKNVTLSDLFGTAQHFLQTFFRKEHLNIRIRPGFFPFVEPGVEIDMQCPFCTNGCSVCKKSRWIELFPAGLIHPNVLREAGIDPDEYSGFAFGFGLTRLTMIRYAIDDIRLLHNGKLNFLEQF